MLPQSLERFLGAPVSPQTSLLCESERVTFLTQHPVPVPDVIILSASWGLTCRILYVRRRGPWENIQQEQRQRRRDPQRGLRESWVEGVSIMEALKVDQWPAVPLWHAGLRRGLHFMVARKAVEVVGPWPDRVSFILDVYGTGEQD